MAQVAIVSAMHEELHAIATDLAADRIETIAGRAFHHGRLHGHDVVLVRSGIGKVAAATTTALLLDRHDVAAILFTGVAGGLGAGVAVGDVVIGRALLQHDMDASPIFPRWEVPLCGRSRFEADRRLSDGLAAAARDVLAGAPAFLAPFRSGAPALHEGLVISGDRFVSSGAESAVLRALLPDALAVEMEGAAVAQVCADFGRPFALLRTISDRADDTAHVDFGRFVAEVAAEYARDILRAALLRWVALEA